MTPQPTVLALSICDYVIVEERTRKLSIIGEFSGIRVKRFPVRQRSFCAFATLTDSLGTGIIKLVITHLDSDEVVSTYEMELDFPDRLKEVRALFNIDDWVIESAGIYEFTLLADEEWIAHRRIRVY